MSEHVSDLLSAYIDEELSEEESMKVKSHVTNCHLCSDELHNLIELKNEISMLYDTIPIPDKHFEETVMSKINNISFGKSVSQKVFTWGISIICILMIFIIMAKVSSVLYVIGTILSSFFNIGIGLFHAAAAAITSIPFVLEIIAVTTLIIVGLSIWSVRFLLIGKNYNKGM
ncbi:anti-sigma factor family protein [Heyndrickxia sp. NPDC080065]|uniref:anti-sigma factor family protein n=1 Tax=Heyndrickxia sp. NPDC080065 TaxID=3390568 RepID=UPI003D08EAD2